MVAAQLDAHLTARLTRLGALRPRGPRVPQQGCNHVVRPQQHVMVATQISNNYSMTAMHQDSYGIYWEYVVKHIYWEYVVKHIYWEYVVKHIYWEYVVKHIYWEYVVKHIYWEYVVKHIYWEYVVKHVYVL